MARVPFLDKEDLDEANRDLLARNINLFRALVHSPGGARAFSRLGGYIRSGSRLDPRLRELAILQVGFLAEAPYEYSHHIKIGRDFGVSDDDIRAIAVETRGEASSLEPLARAVLRGAREMEREGAMSAATFTELQSSLDTEQLTDLVITIAFYCGVVRLLASLEVDVEPDYEPYLAEFPLE